MQSMGVQLGRKGEGERGRERGRERVRERVFRLSAFQKLYRRKVDFTRR